MRRLLIVFGLTLALGLLLSPSLRAEGSWLTSWDEASKQSKKTGKPILMDFTGSDWCGWCIKLKKEVFDTPEFQAWAKKNVILLEVDFPRSKQQSEEVKKQNEDLSQKYSIEGYPTIVFVNHKGDVLGTYGYDEGGPGPWIKNAEKMIKK
ncbi:MAG: thioredoxin family protein [Candidatus Eremiobacterota bacterium]